MTVRLSDGPARAREAFSAIVTEDCLGHDRVADPCIPVLDCSWQVQHPLAKRAAAVPGPAPLIVVSGSAEFPALGHRSQPER